MPLSHDRSWRIFNYNFVQRSSEWFQICVYHNNAKFDWTRSKNKNKHNEESTPYQPAPGKRFRQTNLRYIWKISFFWVFEIFMFDKASINCVPVLHSFFLFHRNFFFVNLDLKFIHSVIMSDVRFIPFLSVFWDSTA